MPLPRRRSQKQQDEETIVNDDPWTDSSEVDNVVTPEKGVRKLPTRRVKPIVAASDAQGGDFGGMRGDYRGERKESMRTIERGESRGESRGSQGEDTNVPDSADLDPRLASTVKKAMSLVKRKRTIAMKEPKPAKVRRPMFKELWALKLTSTHFGVAPEPWTGKHFGQAKAFGDRYGPVESVELMRWAIDNWKAVVGTKFAWMTSAPPPALPSFTFLVKFAHVFKEAKEDAKDQPLQIDDVVKGLNLARKKIALKRTLNITQVMEDKPDLPKKDLGVSVSPLPVLPEWRD